MARVKPVYKPADYPGTPDEATRADVAALFGYLFPGNDNPEIDAAHAGIAITAQNPRLALHLAQMSGFIVRDMAWCQRARLHELAVQTVNLHFNCVYTLRARQNRAQALGLGPGGVLDEEDQLIVDYTKAVVSGSVPDALFGLVVARYGEKEAIECSAAIAWWSLWAMIINALNP